LIEMQEAAESMPEVEEKQYDLARFNLRNLAQNVLEVVRRYAAFKAAELASDGLHFSVASKLEPTSAGARLLIEMEATPEVIEMLATEYSKRIKIVRKRLRHLQKAEQIKYSFREFTEVEEGRAWREA